MAPDGTLTRSQSFDVYGAVRTSQGTATSKHNFVGSLGRPSDDGTGLIYMHARWVDPVTGRLLSQDPARQHPNPFPYVDSNPTNACDPDGRWEWPAPFGWGIAIAAVLYGIGTSKLLAATFSVGFWALLAPEVVLLASLGGVHDGVSRGLAWATVVEGA